MSDMPRGTLLGPGDEIDGFVIEAVAGRGGMGVVYRARQQRPDRVVALKVIAPEAADDPAFRTRFELESSIAAQIEHPNVIPVYAIGEARGILYIAMRFVEGTDLRSLLAAEGTLPPARAAAIVDGAGRALDAAHAHGLVHRDVKPANILLAAVGGHDHVYLTDFGLSRHIQSTSGPTRTGAFLGTIDYVAPEQARGERVDARADIYSLGCVLFTALTGSVPFDADSDLAKLYARDRSPAPSVLERAPDLPPAIDAVVARAMAKTPRERYRSAGDLGRAALAAAAGATLPLTERTVAEGAAAADSEPPAAPAAAAPASDDPRITTSLDRDATPAAQDGPHRHARRPTGAPAAPARAPADEATTAEGATPAPAATTAEGATRADEASTAEGATRADEPTTAKGARRAGEATTAEGATRAQGDASAYGETTVEPPDRRPRTQDGAGRGSSDTPPAPRARAARRRGRLALAAGVLVAAAGAGAIALSGGGDDGGATADTTTPTTATSAAADSAAAIPDGNATANPSFEDDLSGWDHFNSDLTRIADSHAPDGKYVARVALTGSETEYAIDDTPDSVQSSTKGSTYNAVAWVRAADHTVGEPVCISIRERSADGDAAGIATTQVMTKSDTYVPVRASLVATTDGSRIDVHVLRQGSGVQPGEAFLVDAISLTEGPAQEPSPDCEL